MIQFSAPLCVNRMWRSIKGATHPVLFLCIAATSGLLMQTGGATAEEAYEYYYFDQPKPLELDVGRVAFLVTADDRADVAAALAAHDIDSTAISEWAHGWQFVETPLDSRSADGIEQLVATFATAIDGGFVSPVFVDELGGPLFITQDILLRFHAQVDPTVAEEILAKSGAGDVVARDWAGMSGAYRLRSHAKNGMEVLAAANALAGLDEVAFAEPEFMFTGRAAGPVIPDDPLFLQQWPLQNIGQAVELCDLEGGTEDCDIDADEAWSVTMGEPSIIIVILDDGVQLDHPDLMIDPAFGADFTNQNSGGWPVNECDNHGTIVAGSAGALMNGLGIVGVAPECQLASAKIVVSNVPPGGCDGSFIATSGGTVEALAWAEEIGARVTNNSNIYGMANAPFAAKYAETYAGGMIHFAAVGNAGIENIPCPACLPSVNAIGNVGPLCMLAPMSNYGDGLAFTAPGVGIITTDRTGADGLIDGDHHCLSGTSSASPHAAGVAALVLSVNPELSAQEVEAIMQQTSTDLGESGYDTIYGWGFVNAAAAVSQAIPNPADIDGDGDVDTEDLLAMLASWGDCDDPKDCPEDIDGDGSVGTSDLLELLANWG